MSMKYVTLYNYAISTATKVFYVFTVKVESVLDKIFKSYKDTPHGANVHKDKLANPDKIKVFRHEQANITTDYIDNVK